MRREFSLAFEYYPLKWAEVRQSTPMASVPRFAMPKIVLMQTGRRQVQVKKEESLGQTQPLLPLTEEAPQQHIY